MKPDVFVDIEALRQHAERVAGVSANVQQGVEAIRSMSSHPEIYGILCGPLFLPDIAEFEAVAALAFAAVRDVVGDTGQVLRGIADGYEETDRSIARLIAGGEGS